MAKRTSRSTSRKPLPAPPAEIIIPTAAEPATAPEFIPYTDPVQRLRELDEARGALPWNWGPRGDSDPMLDLTEHAEGAVPPADSDTPAEQATPSAPSDEFLDLYTTGTDVPEWVAGSWGGGWLGSTETIRTDSAIEASATTAVLDAPPMASLVSLTTDVMEMPRAPKRGAARPARQPEPPPEGATVTITRSGKTRVVFPESAIPLAPACKSCGTERGKVGWNGKHYERSQGMCTECYRRSRKVARIQARMAAAATV